MQNSETPARSTAVSPDSPEVNETAGAAIAELRMITGFTWEQLAVLFGVSRRSLHFWASGEPMNHKNEEHLRRALALVRTIDRGSADANRAALFAARDDGQVPFDWLVERQYDRVMEWLKPGPGRKRPTVSAELLAARAPQPPEELAGALHDPIHPTSGRLLKATPIRTKRRK